MQEASWNCHCAVDGGADLVVASGSSCVTSPEVLPCSCSAACVSSQMPELWWKRGPAAGKPPACAPVLACIKPAALREHTHHVPGHHVTKVPTDRPVSMLPATARQLPLLKPYAYKSKLTRTMAWLQLLLDMRQGTLQPGS